MEGSIGWLSCFDLFGSGPGGQESPGVTAPGVHETPREGGEGPGRIARSPASQSVLLRLSI